MERDIMSNRKKSYTIRKVEASLNGAPNNITEGSDVGSEPFPFTEEQHISNEQFHFGAIQDNSAL
jgi:hypothetical protein